MKILKLDNFSINCVFIQRDIPVTDYVTLGTIRYGVKLSHGCILSRCAHSPLCKIVHSSKSSSPANMRSPTNSYDSNRSNKIGYNTCKSIDKSSYQCIQASSSILYDTDSSSDVNSANGSCCTNATKCSLPWNRSVAKKMEKQRKPNESCE